MKNKSELKARQGAEKSVKSRLDTATQPKRSPSPSTFVNMNPKTTNTHDRPPSPPPIDQDKNKDKPPSSTSQNHTYSETAHSSLDISVTEKPPTTTFHLCKNLHDRSLQFDLSDDITVSNGSSTKYLTQRLSMMISIPGHEKGIDEDEAPLEAIRLMNAML